MTELVLRGKHNDHRVVEELLTDPAALTPRRARYVRRIVVDSTAIVKTDAFTRAAEQTGTQLLVDPQTPLLLSVQSPQDSWARLPFATHEAVPVNDLRNAVARARLIADVVEFQLDHGATAIMPPYIHLPDPTGRAAEVQRLLFEETAHYVRNDLGLGFDIFPVVSIDRRAVAPDVARWQNGLGRILRVATLAAHGQPFALALSGTSLLTPGGIHRMSQIWRRAAEVGPFVAWHAGDVGLLAVTMGARGYEAGMCATEKCDMRSEQRSRRPGASGPGPRYVGVYIDSLGRSISRSTAVALSGVRSVQADLGCMDTDCCPAGFTSMLGSGRRQHALRCRVVDLEMLDSISARGWRLHHLARKAADAAGAAERIRRAAKAQGLRVGARPEEYRAMEQVALGLRQTARIAIA